MATTKVKVPSQKMRSLDKDVVGETGILGSGNGEQTVEYHSSLKSKGVYGHTSLNIPDLAEKQRYPDTKNNVDDLYGLRLGKS